MVEVKICGLCRPEDGAVAAGAGADYLGVVLAPGYRRTRTEREAEAIFAAGLGVRRVGVFVDSGVGALARDAGRLGLDVVQLHGSESEDYVAEVRAAGPWRIWKAVRPRGAAEFVASAARYVGIVDGILVDGWSEAAAGGTGTRFPWDAVARGRRGLDAAARLIVAGGLTAGTVAEAIARLGPHVVDVSSGVERAPGVKDADQVRAFVRAVRRFDRGAPAAALPQE